MLLHNKRLYHQTPTNEEDKIEQNYKKKKKKHKTIKPTKTSIYLLFKVIVINLHYLMVYTRQSPVVQNTESRLFLHPTVHSLLLNLSTQVYLWMNQTVTCIYTKMKQSWSNFNTKNTTKSKGECTQIFMV